ncbi:beta-1,3-glucosyltransferase isoform X2 [Belonocnema kinseyi]|uniref:beta-1,3-glucosyltransferase isoform X2 n=1 Tax=Belonocnema kinseyi TaxID=2817044 RepID=UPI00143D15CB|nr:beta-1,3-glucosyltransferase isoform X2 [Belonocnema kinseyi]
MNIQFLLLCLQVGIATSENIKRSLEHAKLLKNDIIRQAELMEKDPPNVIFTHELKIPGSWTFSPLLPYLSSNYSNSKWFIFCLENTAIRLPELIKVLSKYNPKKNLWISHALTDQEYTIRHHFASTKNFLKYPNHASGFAITKKILHELLTKATNFEVDFSIDPSYEFALAVWDEGKGQNLTHSSEFCIVSSLECATYPKPFHPCGEAVPNKNIYVGVKTCKKFKDDRLSVILKTWTRYAVNIGFYTDEADENLANSYLVPKTDKGHCAKTYEILKHAYTVMKEKKIDWLLIADDDTILSLSRIQKLLSCYNPKDLIALGERYGFRINSDGYNYITAGGGLVLSAPLVELIINSKVCKCPYPDIPDDMFLFGDCLKLLQVEIIHSPSFHQARPDDYTPGYLASHEAVSFHSFWNIDPEELYKIWFSEDDRQFFESQTHTEL